jgi:glycosyltransferase involved in cell wall biosynthesis
MIVRINFIERKFHEFVSIEKVFRQVEKNLDKEKFAASFQQLPFLNNFAGMIKNLIFFRRAKADVYHVTGDSHYISLILPPRKTVLTIHDLRFLHTRKGLRRYVLKKILLDLPLKRLKYITAISEATRKEILAQTDCGADQIRVIENPLDEIFETDGKKEFNEASPNILQIGASPNKNLFNLILAIEGLNCHLTVVGKLSDEIKNLLREKGIRFENKFGLDEQAVKCEYQKADLVSFCSSYEGFGLPVIEAQAMQTPVVTSDISPLKEVAGGAAVLVDPLDYKSIREGILQIVGDSDMRENLREKGLKNIQRFRPRPIAAQYEALYREVIKNN